MTDKIKLAAIKLKGIGSADRKWILSQLSIQERNKLDPVLAELDSIAFDQVFDIDALLDTAGYSEGKTHEVIAPLWKSQDVAPSILDDAVANNLRKIVARHSDVFLSIFVSGPTVEDDAFLSQIVDRTRHLRVISLAKKRQKAISSVVVNKVQLALIKSAEIGV